MSKPDSTGDGRQPAGAKRSRSEDVSVNRRGFFREILSMGLDKADQAGKRVGRRFGDFVENKRIAPPKPPADPPKSPPPDNTQPRGANTNNQ